jgi:hypothetical protein
MDLWRHFRLLVDENLNIRRVADGRNPPPPGRNETQTNVSIATFCKGPRSVKIKIFQLNPFKNEIRFTCGMNDHLHIFDQKVSPLHRQFNFGNPSARD